MKTIEYAADGLKMADDEVEAEVWRFIRGPETEIKVSNALFVFALRALIAEKHVPHDSVQFVFNGQTIKPDRRSRMPSRPHGFCDQYDVFIGRILHAEPPKVE